MDIPAVIKSLLYHHSCVIIPGFGGLVTEYASAEVHPVQHIFHPPHKKLAFNRNLNSNDGLLIAELSRTENISFEESALRLQQYVRQMESALKAKGIFLLPGIGKFYFDVEKNLQFKEEEHRNFLLPSYGLDQFIAHPVLRRDEVIAALEHSVTVPKRRGKTRAMTFGVVLAILVIIAQVLTVSTDFRTLRFQESGLFKFFNNAFTPGTTTDQNVADRKDTLISISLIVSNTAGTIDSVALPTENISEKTTPAVTETELTPTVKYESKTVTDGNYYVIFGCFKGEENSQVLIDRLKVKGINTRIVVKDSFYRIGIGGFQTMDEAVLQMRHYHQQGFADVWVMKNLD